MLAALADRYVNKGCGTLLPDTTGNNPAQFGVKKMRATPAKKAGPKARRSP
jgi:hypothetical protein